MNLRRTKKEKNPPVENRFPSEPLHLWGLFLFSLLFWNGCTMAKMEVTEENEFEETQRETPDAEKKSSPSKSNDKRDEGIQRNTEQEQSRIERIYLYLDTMDQTLGAYSLIVTYNRNVARLKNVLAGNASGFDSQPHRKQLTTSSEDDVRIRITSFQVNKNPRGNSCIAVLKFERRQKGNVIKDVSVEELSNPDGKKIKGNIQWSRRK